MVCPLADKMRQIDHGVCVQQQQHRHPSESGISLLRLSPQHFDVNVKQKYGSRKQFGFEYDTPSHLTSRFHQRFLSSHLNSCTRSQHGNVLATRDDAGRFFVLYSIPSHLIPFPSHPIPSRSVKTWGNKKKLLSYAIATSIYLESHQPTPSIHLFHFTLPFQLQYIVMNKTMYVESVS